MHQTYAKFAFATEDSEHWLLLLRPPAQWSAAKRDFVEQEAAPMSFQINGRLVLRNQGALPVETKTPRHFLVNKMPGEERGSEPVEPPVGGDHILHCRAACVENLQGHFHTSDPSHTKYLQMMGAYRNGMASLDCNESTRLGVTDLPDLLPNGFRG